jgi:hypothetical protein
MFQILFISTIFHTTICIATGISCISTRRAVQLDNAGI